MRILPSGAATGALVLLLLASGSCAGAGRDHPSAAPADDVEAFLTGYEARFQELYAEASEAEWASNTRIVEGDDTNAARTRATGEALAAYTGSAAVIEQARAHLARPGLTDLQRLQLEAIVFRAARNPATVADLVAAKIAAETAQTERLFGFTYRLDGREVTTGELDEVLRTERDVGRRLAAWRASKEVGPALRTGLRDLRELRNATVQALGYDDFFAYMVSEYGLTEQEMVELVHGVNVELRPLYRELHTWARHELAERYGEPVPDALPAHWLPNRWGQDWSALVEVEGFDVDGALSRKGPEWLVEQAERFYVSLGLDPLPATFWERSSLYPVPAGAGYKKNTHASAWHLDLADDVRSLMSVVPDTYWYETTHHELGHVYYYMAYSNPRVPLVLREGANRAYHEAIGSLMGLAAMQPRFLDAIGLEVGGEAPEPMQLLLREALNYVVFIPWSAGVMFEFERELYAQDLPADRWNQRWWDLKAHYQGIAPPDARGEEWCDPATKTHVNDDPAAYYDYALSFVLLFQLHDHVARELLGEDPHDTSYFGRPEVGEFLTSIMEPGASVDWRALLREKTGEDLSARAMVEYFAPLHDWLREQNRGRVHTLPEL